MSCRCHSVVRHCYAPCTPYIPPCYGFCHTPYVVPYPVYYTSVDAAASELLLPPGRVLAPLVVICPRHRRRRTRENRTREVNNNDSGRVTDVTDTPDEMDDNGEGPSGTKNGGGGNPDGKTEDKTGHDDKKGKGKVSEKGGGV